MPAAAIAIGVGSAVGGVASAIGSSSAAHAQTKAAQQAAQLSAQQQAQIRSDLMPYQTAGIAGQNQLTAQMGSLTAPFSMTQANLEQTPGYQFNLTQGLKAVNNQMGARGLLNSGAAMKGAASYATGLADSTYMDQFNMDQTQKQNTYNKLMGQAQLGENAAAQTGAYGTQSAANQAQSIIGAGNAQAAGAMGIANGIGGIGSNIANFAFANQLLNKTGTGIFGH